MTCSICGSPNVSFALRIQLHSEQWVIYKCGSCGTQAVRPIPSEEELNELYDKFYGDGDVGMEWLSNPNYGVLSFPRQWGIIKSLTKKREGKILDYGCGGGHFLSRVSSSWEKTGVEISEVARSVARQKGVEVFESLEGLKNYENYFDVIVMFATIEHLPNPREVVSQLSRCLRAGGLFAVMTGDVGSLKARLQGEHWNLYPQPGHLYFFTAHSVDYLMKSHGFKKIKHLYTDGGVTQIPFKPLNLAFRAGLEVYHRIPVLNKLPVFDTYYGYYMKK